MAIDDAVPGVSTTPATPPAPVRLPLVRGAVDESERTFEHPIYQTLLHTPGLSVATASIDELLTWGYANSLWVFPMATSCCGIELMAAAASRVDLDRMGTIIRASPRQADVMVVAGTITVKMAPRVKKLWDQMPEPKWCIAMGSCAISGDFYRNLYAVIPGIDTVIPVDVYAPGCPPNPEALMASLIRLQEKVKLQRQGKFVAREPNPALLQITNPSIARFSDPSRDPALNGLQTDGALHATDGEVAAAGDLERSGQESEAEAEVVPTRYEGAAAGTPGEFVELLRSEFGVTEFPVDAPPLIPVAQHHALARRLKALGYRQLVYIVASHWPAGRGRAGALEGEVEHYEVAYGLRTVGAGTRVASWSVRVDAGQGVPSLVGLYAGADWQEREQQDLVGVAFAGHPDPRRLMMPDRWEGHPLRRDYPADKACPPWR